MIGPRGKGLKLSNADGLAGVTGELLSHNMFAYCKNNPINMVDTDGDFPWLILIPVVTFLATWVTTVMTSPDLQTDIAAISQDIYEGDKTSLGLDIAGEVLPGVSGLGRVSKSVKNASKLTRKGVLKSANLPTKGRIRYIAPKKWTPNQPLPKGKSDEFIEKLGMNGKRVRQELLIKALNGMFNFPTQGKVNWANLQGMVLI